MQTLEAAFSFLFFFFFATYVLLQLDYTKPSYSLYEYQLANDVWRVLYLTKALEYYPLNQPYLEQRMDEVESLTGFCIYMEGIRVSSCRGGPACSENKITLEKIWFEMGTPQNIQFTICTPK
ncbi:MAG: hypothetical protein QXF35_00935 [Candidatus Bilamarchaeaceae archaeon]